MAKGETELTEMLRYLINVLERDEGESEYIIRRG